WYQERIPNDVRKGVWERLLYFRLAEAEGLGALAAAGKWHGEVRIYE
ncbi:5505_t:CDS:2, partial [Paraglomus occultum]